jgi:hypothetical protein
VEQALQSARRELSVLDVHNLPSDAMLTADGLTPTLVADGLVYLSPGTHRLELRLVSGDAEATDMALEAGERRSWPRASQAPSAEVVVPPQAVPVAPPAKLAPGVAAQAAEPVVPPSLQAPFFRETRWRTRLAWSFGIMGASLGVAAAAAYGAAARTTEDLGERDAYTAGSGFIEASDKYGGLLSSVPALGLSGAALMAAAMPVGPHTSNQSSSLWAWSALGLSTAALATGIALLAMTPAPISPDNTSLNEPSRYAGTLLVSAAIPLFSYAATFAFRSRHPDERPLGLARAHGAQP